MIIFYQLIKSLITPNYSLFYPSTYNIKKSLSPTLTMIPSMMLSDTPDFPAYMESTCESYTSYN